MNGIITSLANLLRLKGGPQHLPASVSLMIFMVSAYLVQNLVTGQQLKDENSAAKSLLAISLQIAALAGLLQWRGLTVRFPQTLTALAGVGIFFNMVSWVLLMQADPTANQPALALTWFAVFIWSLFVDANIYRHALSVNLSLGVMITVLVLAASYALIEMIF